MIETETPRAGWGPFTSRQLTVIVCVGIVAAVSIPTAAMAAVGIFTSSTATPAVTGTNSGTVANAVGVQGNATAANANARYGVKGSAGGVNGVGVQGAGAKFGVFSDGHLGILQGKSLVCKECVTRDDLSRSAIRGQLLFQESKDFAGPFHRGQQVAAFTVPAGLMCVSAAASAFATQRNSSLLLQFAGRVPAPIVALDGFTNEANSHKALVPEGTECDDVPAGTYAFVGSSTSSVNTDAFDIGSLSIQVFAD